MSEPPERDEPSKRAAATPQEPAADDARVASERERMLDQLRAVNEQLVVTALRAQELAAEATEARQRLEATQAALLDANRRKDLFLAMLGHELRNPLAPILTALDLMKMRSDDTSVREREVIERQVRHMVALIDDLLDVSRIATGKVQLRRVPVELSDVVWKAIEIALPLIESRRHTLSTAVPKTGLAVCAEPSRLAQVIANLLTNAAKYTEPGGTIRVSASAGGGRVVVRVEDDGSGIAPELLAAVFDQFVQSEQGSDRARGGLGLGLAIVRSLVELHDGEVSAHSDGPGKGSEFVVRLPALEEGTVTASTRLPEPASERPPELSARRILVVDDNVDAAEMLAAVLRARHHQVTTAHDGPHALRAASSFHPDAVVIDIGLPIMDGYEVAQALRARESAEPGRAPLRLIALTGYGQDRDRQRSASAGIDVHLVKPVDFDALHAALAAPPSRSAELGR